MKPIRTLLVVIGCVWLPFIAASALNGTPPSVKSKVATALEGVLTLDDVTEMLSKQDINDDVMTFQLAVNYQNGALDHSITDLDENTQVAIVGTLLTIASHSGSIHNVTSWAEIRSIFAQNPLLQQVPGKTPKMVTFKTENDSRISSECKVNTVERWLKEEVIPGSEVQQDKCLQIVEGIDLEDHQNYIDLLLLPGIHLPPIAGRNNDLEVTPLLDIGVIRFPDAQQSLFKLCRVKLDVIEDTTYHVLLPFWGDTKYGLAGEFNCAYFKPNQGMLGALRQSTKNKLLSTAEELFPTA